MHGLDRTGRLRASRHGYLPVADKWKGTSAAWNLALQQGNESHGIHTEANLRQLTLQPDGLTARDRSIMSVDTGGPT